MPMSRMRSFRHVQRDYSGRSNYCVTPISRTTTPGHGTNGPPRKSAGSGTAQPPTVRRGEIWQVELDPVRRSESNKRGPAVIVSNDLVNACGAVGSRGDHGRAGHQQHDLGLSISSTVVDPQRTGGGLEDSGRADQIHCRATPPEAVRKALPCRACCSRQCTQAPPGFVIRAHSRPVPSPTALALIRPPHPRTRQAH